MNIHQPYAEILSSFPNKRVLVIGETILDIYLHGRSSRLCPEAPVPVVDVEDRATFVGGSANTVCNFKALGAHVEFISVVGTDEGGKEAISILESRNISTKYVLKSSDRHTLVKTRIISSGHVVTRFDAGSFNKVSQQLENDICKLVCSIYNEFDAIVISDYDKGIINSSLIDCLATLMQMKNTYVAIDSKRLNFFSKLTPSFIKPNYDEATKLLGLTPTLKNRVDQLADRGHELFNLTQAKTIAITLDSDGSLIFANGKLVHHNEAARVFSPHVSGAGDTYLAAFVLAETCNATPNLSASIATAASTIAISKEYTSTCWNHELQEYFVSQHKKIVDQGQLERLCEAYRKAGKKVVFTNGCFDILHNGHVTYLQCARDFGDVLIVGINTDESIKRIKGETRPINTLDDRMQVLEGLSCVSHVVSFGTEEDDTPIDLINVVKPTVFVKGGDYTKEMLPEASTVERHGGVIHFVPQVPEHSTTSIIQKIKSTNRKNTPTKHHGQLERL
jgi:D-beta-D-heptose 7-phosphate kinase / D-beta-D-heptose 1-phosphate adenosyltransferase